MKTIVKNLTIFNNQKHDPDYIMYPEITLKIDLSRTWPYSYMTAIAYLAEQHSGFLTKDDFLTFQTQFEASKIDVNDFVYQWKDQLDKDNNPYNVMKFIYAGAKPLNMAPPFSHCPRCTAYIWPETAPKNGEALDEAYYTRCREAYELNPMPRFCEVCGQMFKRNDDGFEYKGASTMKGTNKQLKLLTISQPTLEESTL